MDKKLGEQLLSASRNKDLDKVESLIDAGAPVNYPDPKTGNTAFQISAACGDWRSLEALLYTDECNLLWRNNKNKLTSLVAIEGTGNKRAAEQIMEMEKEQGAKVGIVPLINGDVPLDSIMDEETEELGRQLIFAAGKLDTDRIKTLIAAGAPVNYRDLATGNTPFQLSAAYGDWDSLEAFLDTGKCNLLCRNDRNRLTSTLAAEGTGNMEWVQKLMDIEKEQGKKVGIIPRINGDVPLEPKKPLDSKDNGGPLSDFDI